MEQNRYRLSGGDFDFEDLRRQRDKNYGPVDPGQMQQNCEYVVETMDELLHRSFMECDVTTDMSRVELSFTESQGFSCVRRQLRRIAKPQNDGSMYVLTREVIDLSAPKMPVLIARHYGITTTQSADAGRIFNIRKWEVPNAVTRYDWLGGAAINPSRHEILDFDFSEILGELVTFDNRQTI